MKIMGYDNNGLKVNENDFLVKDDGDFARFFRFENGKLKDFATWTCGSLGLQKWEDTYNSFLKHKNENVADLNWETYMEKTNEKIKNIKVEDLNIVSDEMRKYLEMILTNGVGHMPLGDDIDMDVFEVIKGA